jgi:hypothetical protein
LRLGEEIIAEAGERAFVGRAEKGGKGLLNAPKAYINFVNIVNSILNN